MGLVVMGALFSATVRPGAHARGEHGRIRVVAAGRVDARLTFATAEPLGNANPQSEADLRAFVLDGLDVTADGARCEGRYEGAAVTELDGLVLEATFACPPTQPRNRGHPLLPERACPGHRELARMSGPPGSNANVEAVLIGDRRVLALETARVFDDVHVESLQAEGTSPAARPP